MSIASSLRGISSACRHARSPCVCTRVVSVSYPQITRSKEIRLASTSTHTSSRTRLSKDLTPRESSSKKSSQRLYVAPRRSEFTRDSAPHGDKRGTDHPRRGQRREFERDTFRGRKPARAMTRDAPKRSSWNERIDAADTTPTTAASSHVRSMPGSIEDEFDFSTPAEPHRTLPRDFSAPPLLDGLLASVHALLGPAARPTPIQSLALKHVFAAPEGGAWREFLLASETGSGKSLAYLLPMLQALKEAELARADTQAKGRSGLVRPRAIVLAPTHELARQLAGFAKALIHGIKLRVVTASRANVPSSVRAGDMTASKMAGVFDAEAGAEDGEFEVRKEARLHDVDVLVGTPSKVLEMVRGRGWDREHEAGSRVGRPEMGLDRVEWVVVDEADILFDPDFIEETQHFLSDVAKARGSPVPTTTPTDVQPINYPFNFLLTSATIPSSLASHLDIHHPHMTRLVSPDLHRLPSTLSVEYTPYTSGNRSADVERKIRDIWQADAHAGRAPARIVLFGNKRTRVTEVGAYLREHGVPCVVITGAGEGGRVHGSNKHLAGFLRPLPGVPAPAPMPADGARVLLSTSLLARGLDFAPDVSHVFVLDPPRNTADFMHRAGRTARAGLPGKVVVFGKQEGRGAERGREVRRRVEALKSRPRK